MRSNGGVNRCTKPIAAADELCVDRRHGAQRRSRGAAPEMTAHDCATESMRHSSLDTDPKRRAVVVIAAPVPVAVPGFALDRLLQGEGMLAPRRRLCRHRRAARRSARKAHRASRARTRRARRSRRGPPTPTRFMPSFQSPVPNSGSPCEPMARLESSARTQCSYRAPAVRRGPERCEQLQLPGGERSALR